MAGFSKYPAQIDDSSTLPVSTDNVTPVKAEVVNRLRDAVLAIESELGIDPSREFGTVRARLDALSAGGGGGGGGAIEILNNGTEILPSAVSLDFVGAVTVTSPSPLHAKIEVIGGQATQVQENRTPAFNGATIFVLSQTPRQGPAVMMFVDGIKQQQGVDYTVAGAVVTYIGSVSLITSDRLEFWYLVDIGSITSQLTVLDHGSTVETATNQMNFTGNVSVSSSGPNAVTVNVPGANLVTQEEGSTIESVTSQINFIGTGITAASVSSGHISVTVPGLIAKDEGSTIETATTQINFIGAGVTAASTGPGSISVTVSGSASPAKIRVLRSASNLAGNAVTVNKTVTWDAVSALVTAVSASQTGANTQLTTTHTAHFTCSGQLSIQPTVDAISGVTIEVLKNGATIVETISDYGAVWGVGITRSMPFAFPIDLTSGDTLEVRWRHSGSGPSTTQLMTGDSLSWFGISEQ